MLFSRELSFYIITIYLPTMMIVIVSWFSFWIDHKSVRDTEYDILDVVLITSVKAPARVNLCVTTLLAINTTMASIQSSLPPVAYTKV